MPIKYFTETAFTFSHDQTWDYICRTCMKNGKIIKMDTFSKDNSDSIWIRCPECGVEENITVYETTWKHDEAKKILRDWR